MRTCRQQETDVRPRASMHSEEPHERDAEGRMKASFLPCSRQTIRREN